jgi:hypothetical protein
MANKRPVLDLIERQRDAIEAMRSSFELAMRVQPPPATRQALADMVRHLRKDPPVATILAAQARSAGLAVAALGGQEFTPAQVDEVRQGSRRSRPILNSAGRCGAWSSASTGP